QANEPRRFRLDIYDMDVEMHPVLGLLRFRNPLQQELRTRPPARREQENVPPSAPDQVVAEGLRPERRQRLRIVAIENETELRDHDYKPAIFLKRASLQPATPPNRARCLRAVRGVRARFVPRRWPSARSRRRRLRTGG